MKQINDFKEFLKNTVNLNDTRIGLLDGSIEAVETAIRSSGWQPKINSLEPQGSWAHKTIIRPIEGAPFDADLIVHVNPVSGWAAKDYILELYDALEANGTYKGKLKKYSHCVTINYAGERKLDLAPCVNGREYTGQLEVCNKNSNAFERSEPGKYTEWLINKNKISKNNSFRKVTRLVKYLKGIKKNFTCPSFLLTTLLGNQINEIDAYGSEFADTPTALKTLVGRLDNWLQANPELPVVRNPVLYSEIQSTGWDDIKYQNFRNKINLYREKIDAAFDENDANKSLEKWRDVFGDEFAPTKVVTKALAANESYGYGTQLIDPRLQNADLVTRVKLQGIRAIPEEYLSLPQMAKPTWPITREKFLVLNITAWVQQSYGQPHRYIGKLEPLVAHQEVTFEARLKNGAFPPKAEYDVFWRVTNTGDVAWSRSALRGGFYSSTSWSSRQESTLYRGIHIVEAFLIRRRDGKLVGNSNPYYVVIE